MLQAVLPFGPVVCAEGPVTYWQARGFKTSTDRTNDLLDQYSVRTIHGQWKEKDDEVRAALGLVPADTDFVWFVDSDEIWDPTTVRSILQRLEAGDVDSVSFKPYSFYGGFERVMGGFEENFEWHRIQRWWSGATLRTHRPPSVRAPDGRPWSQHHHLGHESTDRNGWRFYHYSYVFPKQIKDKTEYYHTWSRTLPHYYERIYLPWVRGDAATRLRIENEFDGVHDWLPARRGSCRTRPFEGEHPAVIRAVLPDLQRRFREELACAS